MIHSGSKATLDITKPTKFTSCLSQLCYIKTLKFKYSYTLAALYYHHQRVYTSHILIMYKTLHKIIHNCWITILRSVLNIIMRSMYSLMMILQGLKNVGHLVFNILM